MGKYTHHADSLPHTYECKPIEGRMCKIAGLQVIYHGEKTYVICETWRGEDIFWAIRIAYLSALQGGWRHVAKVAMDAGRDDRRRGKKEENNPYSNRTEPISWASWIIGWKDEDMEFEMEGSVE